jgi:cyclophilin family peptidyl-prolyl cis-trans isomerase
MQRRFLTRTAALLAGLALLPLAHLHAQTPINAPRVKLQTSQGDIVLELAADKAPKTVENFLQYVRTRHYDGTIFHRVIDGFMIQGGGFTPDMVQKPTRAPVQNEANNGLKNTPLTVAMARTNDPHSASAQFFINVADNRFLNHTQPTLNGWGYTVFGKVVAGADVVDKIRKVSTGNQGMHQNVPTTPITIIKATLEQ